MELERLQNTDMNCILCATESWDNNKLTRKCNEEGRHVNAHNTGDTAIHVPVRRRTKKICLEDYNCTQLPKHSSHRPLSPGHVV